MSWGVSGLRVRYGAREVIHQVDLTAPPGRLTCVTGGDGAGKTTLLRALVGLVPPDGGTVTRPERTRIGYLSGGPAVYADLTVAENLAFIARAYRMTAERARARTDAVLASTGLGEVRDRLGGQLSGGMRRKLGVAMALLHEPELVVFDEPSTGVDPVSRAELARLITHAVADGAAVVTSTTYLDEAERAGSVLVLDAGETLLAGTPGQLAEQVSGTVWSLPARLTARTCWRAPDGWRCWTGPDDGQEEAVRGAGGHPVPADFATAVMVAGLQAVERRRAR